MERRYRSDDASYCVNQYRDKQGNLFTAVGSDLPEFTYAVTLSGQWKIHPNFGQQLQVDVVMDILPRTKKDIIEFILSISNKLSRVQATALSNVCPPSEFWAVLYNTPEKLYSVCDIGQETILYLQREVKKLASRRDLSEYLGNDLPMTKRQYKKICNMFADDPSKMLDAIKENPFLLIHAGYSFSELDRFSAKHNRFALHDYRRLLAATQSILLDAQKESHTALPDQLLIRKLSDMLRPTGAVEESSILHFLHLACHRKDLVYIGNCFYLGRAYEEETLIAESLSAMARLPAKNIDKKKFQRCMEQYGKKKGFSLSENQQEAVWTVLTRPICVITGGPGTGKSTILDAVLFCWNKLHRKQDWCLMAPTGKAAVRMNETTGENAGTIHSTLDMGVIERFDHAEYPDVKLDNSVIIIDESSMIDLSVAASMISSIASMNGKQHLVIVGDPDQLPSVGYGNVLEDLITSNVIPVSSLNTIYRQAKGNPIITNSLKMRDGDVDLVWDDPMFRRFHTGTDLDNMEAACTLYLRLVKKVGIENVALLSPYHGKTDIATDILNKKLQDTLNPRVGRSFIKCSGKNQELRLGDRVMQLRNTECISNGDVGKVIFVDSKADEDGVCLRVEFESGIVQDYNWEEIYALDLAYAFTVHKSQGSQYKCVLILLPNKVSQFLTRSILYTAVTRSKEYVAIFSPTSTIQYMIRNARKNVRHSQLVQRLRCLYEKIAHTQDAKREINMKRAG